MQSMDAKQLERHRRLWSYSFANVPDGQPAAYQPDSFKDGALQLATAAYDPTTRANRLATHLRFGWNEVAEAGGFDHLPVDQPVSIGDMALAYLRGRLAILEQQQAKAAS